MGCNNFLCNGRPSLTCCESGRSGGRLRIPSLQIGAAAPYFDTTAGALLCRTIRVDAESVVVESTNPSCAGASESGRVGEVGINQTRILELFVVLPHV